MNLSAMISVMRSALSGTLIESRDKDGEWAYDESPTWDWGRKEYQVLQKDYKCFVVFEDTPTLAIPKSVHTTFEQAKLAASKFDVIKAIEPDNVKTDLTTRD